ncbi:MAG: hypothetical protein WC760_11670 [Bacteroidia bacterium]
MLFASAFLSCEKDTTTPGGNTGGTTGILYNMTPPSCLLSQASIVGEGDITFHYDFQKRLIRIDLDIDADEKNEFSYSGNTMTETNTYLQNGTPETNTIIHTLNGAGFIEKSTDDDRSTGGSLNENFYVYNSGGYLIREIEKHSFDTNIFYYSGTSYAYSNGDRVQSYRLQFNNMGDITDSTLDVTYTYFTNRTGHLEHWNAWTQRKGRGSEHELKSESGSSYSYTLEYTDGSNGYPSKMKQTSNQNVVELDLTWKCN